MEQNHALQDLNAQRMQPLQDDHLEVEEEEEVMVVEMHQLLNTLRRVCL
jgi:hypothetical protein